MKAHKRAMFRYRKSGAQVGRTPRSAATSERSGNVINRTSGGAIESQAQNKGKFENGVWHCNCTPRIPAERFQVKKQTRNFGRWFYTCQKSADERCGFFLWEDDAKPREQAAVLSNSNTEPDANHGLTKNKSANPKDHQLVSTHSDAQNNSGARTLREQDDRPSRSTNQGVKRNLPWMREASESEEQASSVPEYSTDEEAFAWDMTGEDERKLSKAVDVASAMTTPRKAAKTHELATPGGRAANSKVSGLQTPPTTTHKSEQPQGEPESGETTPTPIRFYDALAEPTSKTDEANVDNEIPAKGTSPSTDLPEEALALLHAHSINLDLSASTALRKLLERYELRMQGVSKGREISRMALKVRDSRISELSQKNAALETEVETMKMENRRLRNESARAN